MPDESPTSQEPQAEPTEPAPTNEPDPWAAPTWPDVTKLETRDRELGEFDLK